MKMDKKFVTGVYLKPSGHLAVVYVDTKDDKKSWCVDEGRFQNHPIFRYKYPVVIRSTSPYLGWGPTNFLNKSEYLGAL